MHIDEKLLEYATPRQREILEAMIAAGGNGRIAADALGVRRQYPSEILAVVKAKAARQGYSPQHDMVHTVPPGFKVRGVSTYYGDDGVARGQWVKSTADHDKREELLRASVDAMAKEITPVAPIAHSGETLSDLMTLYTFTDYHLGMLAWHKEGGDDWDSKIAEQIGAKAMRALVEQSPASHTAVVNIQGDFMHYDSLVAVTPTHGHPLDADTRFGNLVDIAIRFIRHLVACALEKHENVILLICEGNHDLASSIWLRKLFKSLYEAEARINVHDSELPYYVIEWGRTMLGFHHGHMKKNDQLPTLFAAQFREAWGRCDKVYIHTGHRHHKEDKEHTGCRVIQHTTLAARDAYAARGGWWSERAITAITYHKRYGEAGSVTVTPEMLG